MNMWRLALSVAAGVVHGFSMAWPASVLGNALDVASLSSGLLQCVSLGVLAALLLQLATQDADASHHFPGFRASRPRRSAWRQGALLSALFACSAMAATWGWLYVSMHRYGGMPSWLAALAVLLLAAALSLYFALAGALWVALFRRWMLSGRLSKTLPEFRQALAGLLLFSALWTLAELCRGQLFTGFPWGAGGYAHLESSLAAYAPWVGVYGIGAISACVAMGAPLLISSFMAGRTQAWLILSFSLLMVAVLIPMGLQHAAHQFTQAAGTLKVRLLQGNIAQDEKFIPGQGVQQALSWYAEQLLANSEPLVVTPETAIPVLPQQLAPAYWQVLKDKYARPNASAQLSATPQAALVGIPMGGPGVGYSNSVLTLGPADVNYRYDKHHLVPFGEYVPPFFQWFVRMMNMPLGDFAQDRPPSSVFKWQGQRLLPQICYEDLFGEEVARYFAKPEEAPTVLVNMSNLAWFDDTTAIAQHVAISRMRAMEFERPIIRATNTGLTGWVDAQGALRETLPPFKRGALVIEFEGRSGLTPYAQWTSQWGLAPLWWLCAAIVLVLGVFSRRSGTRSL